KCSLLLTIDDATSRIGNGKFAKAETTDDYFDLFEQYFLLYGLPDSLYVDRHGIFRVNQANCIGEAQTQLHRALEALDVELICANSPQAKGRVERANRTLQDRLVKEMRLRGISSMEAGNAYLPEFIADHNRRFAELPASTMDAHRTALEFDLENTLCRRYERTLTKDLALQFENDIYAITQPKLGGTFRAGMRIEIYLHRDGTTHMFHRGQELEFRFIQKQIRKAPIVAAKDLDEHLGRFRSMPQNARTPAANHPWKSPAKFARLARLATP
ncbi:MAG: ISNCY family transposase, partial [Candidatus Eremiobacteraeota bacterium]|nr:ISNCY family transposase [Candidatus Eremiobacteraeota bacterium]